MDQPLQPLQPLTTTRAMRRPPRAGAGSAAPYSAAPIEVERWISGPYADPLRSTPWQSRPLPRPRYAAPDTIARRIRSILILLCVLALIVGMVALAFELNHLMFGTPLPTLPHLHLP